MGRRIRSVADGESLVLERLLLLFVGLMLGSLAHGHTVEFLGTGTMGIQVRGTCETPEVIFTTASCLTDPPQTCNQLTATVDLNGCTTNNGLRDKHMGELLKVSSLPKAILKATVGEKTFHGSFTLAGETKNVEGSVTNYPDGGFTLQFPVKMSEHGIKKPSYLGVTVSDEVQVTATYSGKKR